MTLARNWPRYAQALDLHLEGWRLDDIAAHFGVSRERARQLVTEAKAQLGWRVFGGRRPLLRDRHEKIERRLALTLLVLDIVDDVLLLREHVDDRTEL